MHLFGISASWLPQIKIDDCDEQGKNCLTSYGLYPDIIDEMGKQLNFTWENHKEINGDWGLTPISGPFNRSGTFGGIIGEIKNGNYMFNTAGWKWLIDRYELMDFVGIQVNRGVLVTSLKPPNLDLSLFIRPFTIQSWIGKKRNKNLLHKIFHCCMSF